MITRSHTWAGFQCPVCGKIQIQRLSAFDFSGKGEKTILCDHCCQAFAGMMHPEGESGYQLQIACLDCAGAHSFSVKRGTFWLSGLREFQCPNTGETILVIGDRPKVERFLEELFSPEDDFEDEEPEFESASAMMQFIAAVEHIKTLGDGGKLSCACGNPQIQLQMEDGELVFLCTHCGRSLRMDISNSDKLKKVQSLENIHLT